MTNEERILRLENAFSTLVELARNQSERMDEYERRTEELAEAQKQTEVHLSAVSIIISDLGIAVTELKQSTSNLKDSMSDLRDNMSNLSNTVSDLSNTVSEIGHAQIRTERALASLAEKFDQHVSEGHD